MAIFKNEKELNSIRAVLANALTYTKGEAAQARIYVMSLLSYFQKLDKTSQDKYQPLVDAVRKSWDEYEKSKIFYTFEQAVKIGQTAQNLLKSIAQENPSVIPSTIFQAPIGETPSPIKDVTDLLTVGAVIAGGVLAYSWYKGSKNGK